jgi:UDP-N-acetylglucosamine 2-epimerase (non-hydrolysing)
LIQRFPDLFPRAQLNCGTSIAVSRTELVRVLTVVGTRPEAIKMAPVIRALRKRIENEVLVVSTAQHRHLLDQVLTLFQIVPDVDLDLMQHDQTLADLTARALTAMSRTIETTRPDLVMVQGDTTTVLASALAAFFHRVPVAHVEAGLRSRNLDNPFPEEANRQIAGVVASVHLAPTRRARQALLDEGVSPTKIVVTGNTVVDALEMVVRTPFSFAGTPLADVASVHGRLILITSHRRESFGEDLNNICAAVHDIVRRFDDVLVVYPVHPNPKVRRTVEAMLRNVPRVFLTDPLDYLTFVNLMKRADLILTDSGGVQEEAPTLGKKLLVLRRVTERPEASLAGLSRVVGTDRRAIVTEVIRLLAEPNIPVGPSPYGDGRAAARIAEVVSRWSQGETSLLNPEEEFSAEPGLVMS